MVFIDIRKKLPRKGLQEPRRNLKTITKIIVHHDAVIRPNTYNSLARYVSEANYHINNKKRDGIQYHYKIDNVGDIFYCRDISEVLYHAGNYPVNKTSIAVCVDGNFEKQTLTSQQIKGLQELLDNLSTKHPEFPANQDDVFGHKEVALKSNPTACPGKNLLPLVQKYRKTKQLITKVMPKTSPVAPKPQEKPEVVSTTTPTPKITPIPNISPNLTISTNDVSKNDNLLVKYIFSALKFIADFFKRLVESLTKK